MDVLLALLARVVVAFLQALPLGTVAWLGRVFGALAYVLDGRHRNVAQRNITECFPEKSATEVRSLARENFQRIGESFAPSSTRFESSWTRWSGRRRRSG
jgi:KDO2-lipid IV(A) lauroyltransferase